MHCIIYKPFIDVALIDCDDRVPHINEDNGSIGVIWLKYSLSCIIIKGGSEYTAESESGERGSYMQCKDCGLSLDY